MTRSAEALSSDWVVPTAIPAFEGTREVLCGDVRLQTLVVAAASLFHDSVLHSARAVAVFADCVEAVVGRH